MREGCHVNMVKQMCYHFHVMAEVSQVLFSFFVVVGRFFAHFVRRKTDSIDHEKVYFLSNNDLALAHSIALKTAPWNTGEYLICLLLRL